MPDALAAGLAMLLAGLGLGIAFALLIHGFPGITIHKHYHGKDDVDGRQG